jgi:hypothetical protein
VAHIGGELFYDATFQILRQGDEPTLPPEFVVGSNIFAVAIVAGFWVPMHIIGRLEIRKSALHFPNVDNAWLQVALKSQLISVASAQDDPGGVLPYRKQQTTEGIRGATRNESQSVFGPTRSDPLARTDAKWNAITWEPNGCSTGTHAL